MANSRAHLFMPVVRQLGAALFAVFAKARPPEEGVRVFLFCWLLDIRRPWDHSLGGRTFRSDITAPTKTLLFPPSSQLTTKIVIPNPRAFSRVRDLLFP